MAYGLFNVQPGDLEAFYLRYVALGSWKIEGLVVISSFDFFPMANGTVCAHEFAEQLAFWLVHLFNERQQ